MTVTHDPGNENVYSSWPMNLVLEMINAKFIVGTPPLPVKGDIIWLGSERIPIRVLNEITKEEATKKYNSLNTGLEFNPPDGYKFIEIEVAD